MKIIEDEDRFEALQPWFVANLIDRIRMHLVDAGVDEESQRDLCGNIAFSVCTEIDGSSGFEVDGIEYDPILCFSEDEDSMFFPGGHSNLHDYVFGALEHVFEEQGDEPAADPD